MFTYSGSNANRLERMMIAAVYTLRFNLQYSFDKKLLGEYFTEINLVQETYNRSETQ